MIAEHQLIHASTTNAWYTPPQYLDVVRKALGTIDLDPASDSIGNSIIQSTAYYTESDDGLSLPWFGNVFCNPPYGRRDGRSNQALWTQKAIQEYDSYKVHEAILLVNAQTGEKWFQALDRFSICLVRGRIKFLNALGKAQSGPTHCNCFVYLGPRTDVFESAFSSIGRCIPPVTAFDHLEKGN